MPRDPSLRGRKRDDAAGVKPFQSFYLSSKEGKREKVQREDYKRLRTGSANARAVPKGIREGGGSRNAGSNLPP